MAAHQGHWTYDDRAPLTSPSRTSVRGSRAVSRPLPQLQIVFLLVGSTRRRSTLRDAVRAHLDGADFDRLARELAERRILPLIGSRAIEAAPELVPDEFRTVVREATSAARARGLLVEATMRRLVKRLSAAGIRALALKGPPLALEAHGDLGMRETADIDLLVPVDRLDAAAEVLRREGYAAPAGGRRRDGLPDLHLELRHHSIPPVDLHWRVYWYEHAFSQALLASADPGEPGC